MYDDIVDGVSEPLVGRLCKSDAHEEPRFFNHRREVLEDGRVRLTCAVCGEERIIPPFSDQQLIDLHEEGLNDREVAERLGANRRTVLDRRRRLGLESNRPHVRDHQRFLALYEKGMNDPEIANALGVTDGMVYNYRKRHGLASNWNRSLFTDQQFLTLYEKGLNDAEIAKTLGVPKYVVGYCRRRLGLEFHAKRTFSDKQVIALHQRGLNDAEIAKKLGANSNTVRYHRNKLGLKPVGKHKHGVEAVREVRE